MLVDLDELVTAAQAADLVGVQRQSVLKAAKEGRLRPVVRFGEHANAMVLFNRADVFEVWSRCSRGPGAASALPGLAC